MITETIGALFLVTSGWFWLTSLVLFALLTALSENEHNVWAGLSLGGFMFATNAYNPGVFDWSVASIAIMFVIYFAVGGVWSFWKWFYYARNHAEVYKEAKLSWIDTFNKNLQRVQRNNPNDARYHQMEPIARDAAVKLSSILNDDQMHDFKRHLFNHGRIDAPLPDWKENKNKIMSWILWWPMSFIWTMLSDPFVRVAKWIYYRSERIYVSISVSVAKSVGVSIDE